MNSMHRTTSVLAIAAVAICCLLVADFTKADGNQPDSRTTPDRIEYRPTLLVQLRVADLEKSVHFYRDLLDMKVVHRNDALQWVKVSHGMNGVTIGIGQGVDIAGSGTVSINLGVHDVDAARRLLEERGVKFLKPTITVPNVVKLADLLDPDGNKIRLAQTLSDDSKDQTPTADK